MGRERQGGSKESEKSRRGTDNYIRKQDKDYPEKLIQSLMTTVFSHYK